MNGCDIVKCAVDGLPAVQIIGAVIEHDDCHALIQDALDQLPAHIPAGERVTVLYFALDVISRRGCHE